MSTTEERKVMDTAVDTIIPKACNGNKDAEEYLHDIAWANRRIDDIYDKDVDVPKDDIEYLFFILLVKIVGNPFFLKNFQALYAQHIVIYNAWMDANKLEKSEDETKRRCALVLKEQVRELIPLVAFITGGTGLMHNISSQVRELFTGDM